MFPSILVTRCASDNQVLAPALQRQGFSVYTLPFLTPYPLPFDENFCEKALRQTDGIIITSRSVFTQHPDFWEHQKPLLLDIPVYIVGQKTAEMARVYFPHIATVKPSATELAEYLKQHCPCHSSLIFFSGKDYTLDFKKALPDLSITHIPVYEAKKATTFEPSIRDALRQKKINIILFYSQKTVMAFEEVFLRSFEGDSIHLSASIQTLCISERIADSLVLPWKKRFITHPDDVIPFLLRQFS